MLLDLGGTGLGELSGSVLVTPSPGGLGDCW